MSHSIVGLLGAHHTFSEEEKVAFSEHINICLRNDPIVSRHLPLDTSSMDLFEKTHDGLILCRLINLAQSDAIDERVLNTKDVLNVYQKTENQNLALNAARSIGCQVINIGAQDLIEGRPILVLGLVWQIIKIQLLAQISLKNFPELVLLLQEDETMPDFIKLPPEKILMRWLNYHLAKGGSSRVVTNFGSDLADSEVYSVVLNRLNASLCPLITATDNIVRAGRAIDNARQLGVNVFIKPKDICDGNRKLNVALVAQLFNTCHGLVLEPETAIEFDFSELELDDAGDSREERVFRMWINSLNIENVYLNNLFADLQDGYNLLQVMDRVEPGCVVWKRVNKDPKSRYKKLENANYAIEIAKNGFKFSMINVGGLDIIDGSKKMILAVIWQLMRRYTLRVLREIGEKQGQLTDVTDEQIIAYANSRVAASGATSSIRSFKDSSLKTSAFLLDLIAAIEPRAVNRDLLSQDNTDNARYCISSARKIGACVFLTHEDITEVKSKMILTFIAGLWMADIAIHGKK